VTNPIPISTRRFVNATLGIMSLRPAIIVMEPDMPELLLVVEIRANVPEQESDDTELKSYTWLAGVALSACW
jgi:hypothetical protein